MLRRVHKRIATDAQSDELTGLAKRKAFERTLQLLLDSCRESESSHTILQIDLDRFRMVNMACGFDGGDQALKRVARIIEETMTELDGMIARIGADEFAVVLFDTPASIGEDLADRLAASIREMEFNWQQHSTLVTATIAVLPVDRTMESVAMMMQNLAGACRAGKEMGGDRSFVYTNDDAALSEQRAVMQLATQVEQWLAEGRIRFNVQLIQPALAAEGLPHYEVLISVADDNGVLSSPVKFIEAAERYSKMPLVDRFVLSRIFEWMAAHPQALEGVMGLSINLSGQSIMQEDFLSFVLEQFERTGAPPGKVCFELTETAAVGNLFRATDFMLKCKVMGCHFSLDDFGAGMSSYSYLRRLPVDYLKIDGSFVKNMVTDESDLAVVRSINEIGHFLGKKTVAEYVHDEQTAELARSIGIDYLQGWGVEKPKPIETLAGAARSPVIVAQVSGAG
jgi:diguanylate cyclase (GGDEF)-like protein